MTASKKVSRAVEAELLRRELMLVTPSVRRDPKRVARLLADDFVEIGSSGRLWSRDEMLAHLARESYQPPVIENFDCRPVSEGVVLVTYRAMGANVDTGERAVTLRSSLWVKETGGWHVRFHQGTRC